MEKILRSLIHERFPLDLRFKIELLSRRRDIINKEKQEELIKLLREFDIKDIVQLGPGTNRYAFRLDGFVIKVATDHDGKIDNMKEFKMAKRLFPYVTKTYEVSDNGTILVAEYIQPFASFAEMCKYSDRIREILTKLSTVYLIGDVGISPINYSNWGLRIGTDEPVCLDFAYVYDVSSELFLCRHCNNGTMLVPNKDFTELICPNKGCGRKYLFADIRAKIGNDLHRHQIGDLGEEGYRLSASHVPTQLDESRSNYLVRQKKLEEVNPKENKEEEFIDDFYLSNNKEENNMGNVKKFRFTEGQVINAVAASIEVTAEDVKRAENGLNGTNAEEVEVSFPIENINVPNNNAIVIPEVVAEVAFAGTMEDSSKQESIEVKVEPMIDNEDMNIPNNSSIMEAPIPEEKQKVVEVEVQASTVPDKNNTQSEAVAPKELVENKIKGSSSTNISFNSNFTDNMERAISKLSNKIGNHMHEILLFDEVKNYIRDKKMYPDTFYKALQNAIFRSLIIFCGFQEKDVPNQNGKGTHKEFIPPVNIAELNATPTLMFISRFWNTKSINAIENGSEIMDAYRNTFSDFVGIQHEWIEVLANRLRSKMQITDQGINEITRAIEALWCIEADEQDLPLSEQSEEYEESFETSKEQSQEPTKEESQIPVSSALSQKENTNRNDGIAFGGTMEQQLADDFDQNEEDEEEEDIYDDEEEESNTHTYVELRRNVGGYDIIKLITADDYDTITIPFYAHLDKIDVNQLPESSADNRNGVWDWLIHFMCDYRFITHDPEKWLKINDTPSGILSLFKFVILQSELENGGTLMGFTVTDYVIELDEEGNETQITDYETLAKINAVIINNCAYGDISHLGRSLELDGLHEESEIEMLIQEAIEHANTEEAYEENEENEEIVEGSKDDNTTELNDVNASEAAAIAAVMGSTPPATTQQETDRETVYKDPNDQPMKMFQVHRRK